MKPDQIQIGFIYHSKKDRHRIVVAIVDEYVYYKTPIYPHKISKMSLLEFSQWARGVVS